MIEYYKKILKIPLFSLICEISVAVFSKFGKILPYGINVHYEIIGAILPFLNLIIPLIKTENDEKCIKNKKIYYSREDYIIIFITFIINLTIAIIINYNNYNQLN